MLEFLLGSTFYESHFIYLFCFAFGVNTVILQGLNAVSIQKELLLMILRGQCGVLGIKPWGSNIQEKDPIYYIISPTL